MDLILEHTLLTNINNISLKEPDSPYKLFTTNDFIRINNIKALELELKLNLSTYSRQWIKLGDVLYKWRLDPSKYQISIPLDYSITFEQLEWIKKNL